MSNTTEYEVLVPGGHQRLVDNVLGLMSQKPDATAAAPDLTAGAAHGITGDGPTETAAWLQRTSTSDGPTTAKSIRGRTLRWNQLVTVPFMDGETQRGITFTANSDGTVSLSGTSTQTIYKYIGSKSVAGHTYLVRKGGTLATDATLALYNDGGGITVNSQGSAIATANAEKKFFFRVASNATVDGTVLPQIFDLTAMFGAGNEPSTVAEFEALFPLPYYEYDAGSLLPVSMAGIETTGFNQWDEETEQGLILGATGLPSTNGYSEYRRAKNYYPCFPLTEYHCTSPNSTVYMFVYDADLNPIKRTDVGSYQYVLTASNSNFTTPANARYMRFSFKRWYVYDGTVCINLSDPTRNGEYEPHWSQQRTIPAGTLRSAGTVYDEQTATEHITRVGEVDLGTLTWSLATGGYFYTSASTPLTPAAVTPATQWITPDITCDKYDAAANYYIINPDNYVDKTIVVANGTQVRVRDTAYTDAAAFQAAMNGVMLHYDLATPTTVEIDPPLNLTYRTETGGTERVMVPTGEQSAPPTLVTAQGYTAESLRDAALSAIAPVENGLASTNYGVGSYLVHGGQLCKVTTAIASGEAIAIGTNVTATTVMAEVIALIAQ